MQSRTKLGFTKTCVVLFSVSGSLLAEEPVLIPRFVQIEQKQTKASSVYVLGYMFGNSGKATDRRMITVNIPIKGFKRLCLWVRSIDDQYLAFGEFDIGSSSPGTHTLSFGDQGASDKSFASFSDWMQMQDNDKLTRLFNSYGPGEIVLDGRAGDSCSEPVTLHHVPMAWGGKVERIDEITLYLNAGGLSARTIFPLKANDLDTCTFECQSVSSARPQRTFDTSCDIKISGMKIEAGWLELHQFGDVQRQEDLDLEPPSK